MNNDVMRKVFIALLLLAFMMGCKKETVTESSSDFAITLFREYNNGERLVTIEKPVLNDEVEGPNVYFTVDGDKLYLRIGRNAKPDTKLGANIVFLKETEPMKVIGTYKFPDDRDKADIELFEYTLNGFSRTSIPSEGTLIVKYDPLLKRFSGTVEQLKYQIPFRSDYVFQLISMKFDGVAY
jgi:hypothetical protein